MRGKNSRLAILAVLCLLMPVLARSWTLTTKIMTVGGQLQVRDDAPQTGGGSIQKTYTTHRNVPVTLAANSGYQISRYSINGVDQPLTSPTDTVVAQMGLLAYPGVLSQSIAVYFSQWLVAVSVTAGDAGGSVSPAGSSNKQVGTANVTYVFTPASGNRVVAIDGLPPSGYTLSTASLPSATLPAGVGEAVTLTLTVPPMPLSINGYFLGVVANPGANQIVLGGQSATLDGSASIIRAGGGQLTYDWSQTAGPAVTLSDATAVKPTFPTVAGQTYTFRLSVTNGTYTHAATTTVTAIDSASAYARRQCMGCHEPAGVGPGVFQAWSSSSHEKKLVTCPRCHVGADAGGHPGSYLPVSQTTFINASNGGNFCFTCHHRGNNLHFNTEAQLANLCVGCHAPNIHNPAATIPLIPGMKHFNGYTSAANPLFGAAYVTPASACANCHITAGGIPDAAADPAYLKERTDWSTSGHGDTAGRGWLSADFKKQSGCVQCHTTRGFIAYSSLRMSAAWGVGTDVTRGVLSCDGCHSDFRTGALRPAAPYQPYPGDSYTLPDIAASNICLRCHSGARSGRSIKSQIDFSNLAFIDPHYSAASGILFKSIGYEFAGRNYANSWHFRHDKIGIGNYTVYNFATGTDGPCAGCHMTSAAPHSFSPVAKDAGGAVTAITGTSCGGCHTGPAYLDASRMNSRKAKYATILLAFRKVLEGRGIYYAEAAPYFFTSGDTSDPASAVTNWGSSDTMGAAFNFALLQHESGAYAHNMIYAKRLVYDSIDYLDDGVLNDSVGATLAGLSGLDVTQKATAAGYLMPSGSRP